MKTDEAMELDGKNLNTSESVRVRARAVKLYLISAPQEKKNLTKVNKFELKIKLLKHLTEDRIVAPPWR